LDIIWYWKEHPCMVLPSLSTSRLCKEKAGICKGKVMLIAKSTSQRSKSNWRPWR
jgi:hypothetical protein